MGFKVFPFQKRPCPNCASQVSSTVVYDDSNRDKGYTFHDCAKCGHLVSRIVGYDKANPNGNNYVATEAVTSQPEIGAVIRAALRVPEEHFHAHSR